MQRKVKELEDSLNQANNVLETTNQNHANTVSKLNAEHSEELKRLDSEKTKRERDHIDSLKEARDKFDEEIRRTLDAHRAEMREYRDEQERKDQEFRRKIDLLKEEYANNLSDQ